MAGNGAPAAAEPLRLRADDEPNVQNAILLAAASGSTGEGCKALDGGIKCASIPALIYDQRSKSEAALGGILSDRVPSPSILPPAISRQNCGRAKSSCFQNACVVRYKNDPGCYEDCMHDRIGTVTAWPAPFGLGLGCQCRWTWSGSNVALGKLLGDNTDDA
eukprot:603478-Pleurochrysis_carterae.AAC.1